MVLIADGLVAWLVALVGEAGRRKLTEVVLGTEQERALATVATSAIRGTATDLAPAGGEPAERLGRVISQVFAVSDPSVDAAAGGTLFAAIGSGVRDQLAILGDPEVTGVSVSSSDLLGVDWRLMAERLTTRLTREIFLLAAGGGPLRALASQLNHDLTHLQNEQAAGVLAGLSEAVSSVLREVSDLRGMLASSTSANSGLVRSAYLNQVVRRIAPGELRDRGSELEELARFCTGPHDRSYLFWQGPAWAGKSALMSWFAIHPPPEARVLSFFVTSRWAGHSDRSAFVEVMLEQAAAVLREPLPPSLPATREAHLLELLERAAEASQQQNIRLVLLIDGLDEDHGVSGVAEGHSIAALLPPRPPAGMRIVVAARPHPPIPPDVVDDHPLRDRGIVLTLRPSRHAAVLRFDMQRDLARLVRGGKYEQDLLGFVTAAGGGLSAQDLAELTRTQAWQVEERLGSVAGRSFDRRSSQWRPPEAAADVYVLGHEDLQASASQLLGGARLEVYRRRLHAWADGYRRRSWPDSTPEYLLRGYYSMLRDTGDVPRMVSCATDAVRHDRMLDISGGDTAALAEIAAVQDTSCRLDVLDIQAMVLIALHRDVLLQRNANIPAGLPAAWAWLGRPSRAEALLGALTDPRLLTKAVAALAPAFAKVREFRRATELASAIDDGYERANVLDDVVSAMVAEGEIDQAESLARSVFPPDFKDRALACLVDVVAAGGDLDRAAEIANSIPAADQQMQALALLAQRSTIAGDGERARRVVAKVRALLHSSQSDSGVRRHMVLLFAVRALAAAGDFDQAERLARSESDTREQLDSLNELVRMTAAAGDLELAERLARSIGDDVVNSGRLRNYQGSALASVAVAAARVGDLDRASRLLTSLNSHHVGEVLPEVVAAAAATGGLADAEALIVAATGTEDRPEYVKTDALTALATEAARLGRLPDVEKVVGSLGNVSWRADALAAAAVAAASAGLTDQARSHAVQAEALARSVGSKGWRDQALMDVSRALAIAGHLDDAAGMARRLADPGQQAGALTFIVRCLVAAGQLDQAETIAKSVRNTKDQDYRGHAQALIAVAFADEGNIGEVERILYDIASLNAQIEPITILCKVAARNGMAGTAEYYARLVAHDNWQAPLVVLAQATAITNAHRAEEIARAIPDKYWKAQALSHVAEAACGSGDFDRAYSLSQEAEELIGPPLWSVDNHWLLSEWAEHYASLGALSGDVPELYRQGRALLTLVSAVASLGDINRAERLAWCISDPSRRAETLADLAEAAACSGKFDQAEALAESITESRSHVEALARLAEALVRVGQTDRAGQIVGRAEETTRAIANPVDQMKSCWRLLTAASVIGDLGLAEDMACAISDPDQRAEALAALAEAVTDESYARKLLAQAYRSGTWTKPLPAVAALAPDTLPAITAAFDHLVPQLEELEELPEETFNPDKTWQKIGIHHD